MAKLGTLWYDLNIKDNTDKDLDSIRKKVQKELDGKLNIKTKFDGNELSNQIRSVLDKEEFKINVVIDKAKTSAVVRDALERAGYGNNRVKADDVRAARIAEIEKRSAEMSERNRLIIERYNQQLERGNLQLERMRNAYRGISSESGRFNDNVKGVTDGLSKQFNIAGQLRNQIADLFSVYAAERFLRNVVEIGGEFQKQRLSLRTMYGDISKADALFGRIKSLAVESPFSFMDLAGYTKQLAAFQIPYDEIYDTTKRLADISAGLGVDMGRLILAFGQVRSAAFLRGRK